jgi:hypothetical protein
MFSRPIVALTLYPFLSLSLIISLADSMYVHCIHLSHEELIKSAGVSYIVMSAINIC